jgi:hypothetical protein
LPQFHARLKNISTQIDNRVVGTPNDPFAGSRTIPRRHRLASIYKTIVNAVNPSCGFIPHLLIQSNGGCY